MTTVEALKALYVNLGGEEADFAGVNLNPEAVEKIAGLLEGGVGGGADFVIQLNSAELASATTATLVSGDYAKAKEKAIAGKPVTAQVSGMNKAGDDTYGSTFTVLAVKYTDYVSPPDEDLFEVMVLTNAVASNAFYVSTASGGDNTALRNCVGSGSGSVVSTRKLQIHADGTIGISE